MMTNTTSSYAFRTRLDLPYEQAVERVIVELKKEGFGVLTEIDVKATLRDKLNTEFRNYVILGACNPPLAHRALSTDLEVGLLLPCNVVVYEENGGSVVAILDPFTMLGVVNNSALEAVAQDARARLQKVIRALSE